MRTRNSEETFEISKKIQSSEGLKQVIKESLAHALQAKGKDKSQDLKEMINALVLSVINATLEYQNAEYEERERRYEKLFLELNIGIGLSCLTERKIIEVNPYFCNIFEVSPTEVNGQNIDDFIDKFVSDIILYQTGKVQFKEFGEVTSFELPIMTARGNKKWILVSSRRFDSINREAFSIMDVTAIKEMEKLKEYTVHVMAHDFRGPLACAGGFAKLLNRKVKFKGDNALYMYHIMHSLDRVEKLVNNYLDIMKMEQGTYNMKLEIINLKEFLSDLSAFFNVSEKSNNGVIKFSPKSFDGNCEIIGDKDWLEHMFNNILANSVEETLKEGESYTKIEIIDGGDYFEILFSNPGVIPDDIISKLFQEKYIKSTKQTGNGIGAYFANLIAKAHLGRISIKESNEKKGTVISVILLKNLLENKEFKLDL